VVTPALPGLAAEGGRATRLHPSVLDIPAIPEDILTKVDRTSMAVSLTRVPLLDHVLWVRGAIPLSSGRGRESSQARAGRGSARRHPQSTQMGFGLPIASWFGATTDYVRDVWVAAGRASAAWWTGRSPPSSTSTSAAVGRSSQLWALLVSR
jgi:hypothetical protein